MHKTGAKGEAHSRVHTQNTHTQQMLYQKTRCNEF